MSAFVIGQMEIHNREWMDEYFSMVPSLVEEHSGQIATEYRDGRTIVSGQYLHLFLLGVAEQFARRGIGQQLVAACLQNGAAKGYTSAITEATNPVSQHIFRGLGFTNQAERSYGEYRFGGSAVFSSISEHGGPMTMDRNIEDR